MLEFNSANPPVPTVENVSVSASYRDRPASISAAASTAVMARYILYRIKAVWRTFGTSFPTDGPGLSARIRCILELPDSGRTAIRNTSTPMPPLQCVKQRQNAVARESSSTEDSTLAPVVVNPDIVSNRASI